MGERGPLPKPYARRRNKRTSSRKSVLVQRPAMPRTLKGESRAEWNRVVPELEGMEILASIDRGLLIRYCVAWADWVELEGMLQLSGKLIKGQKGNPVRNPLWLMKRDAEQIVTDLARQLGLSPVARLRAGVRHEVPKTEPDTHWPTALEEYRRMLTQP